MNYGNKNRNNMKKIYNKSCLKFNKRLNMKSLKRKQMN